MQKVLIYGQDLIDENIEYVNILLAKLTKEKIEVFLFHKFQKALVKHDISIDYAKIIHDHNELLEASPDFVLTMGGDGTILNAVTLVRDSRIPILGINLGRLGFLAVAEKKRIVEVIDELIQKNFSIQKRHLLCLESNTTLFGNENFALNDFTIHKYASSSVVVIHTYVDDMYLNSYWADGLIVATPTGSTGYSLSCGGPIVLPNSGNFVITPVAPHHLTVRPIVIPDSSVISFEIEGRSDNYLCTLDSRYKPITSKHKLRIKRCDFHINLVILDGFDFMSNVYNKLHWGKDNRKSTRR